MPFATTHTVCLNGALGHLIEVQADVSPGQVLTTLVGRPDVSLNEARTAAGWPSSTAASSGPPPSRITMLLSPADLAKRGTHFDLAIASPCLPPPTRCPATRWPTPRFVGELTLVRRSPVGLRVLPMVLAAAERGITPGLRPGAPGSGGGDGARA